MFLPNGASMKFPLSDATGPAATTYISTTLQDTIEKNEVFTFATAMRSVALDDPRVSRFCRTFAYAKRTTSTGTPARNLVFEVG